MSPRDCSQGLAGSVSSEQQRRFRAPGLQAESQLLLSKFPVASLCALAALSQALARVCFKSITLSGRFGSALISATLFSERLDSRKSRPALISHGSVNARSTQSSSLTHHSADAPLGKKVDALIVAALVRMQAPS